MSTPQKMILAVTMTVLAAASVYEGLRSAQLRGQIQTLQRQQAPLIEQIQQLQRERDDTTNRLALMAAELAQNDNKSDELLKLRGEVARSRATAVPTNPKSKMSPSEAADLAAFEQVGRKMKDATSVFAFEGMVSQMKQRLHLTPDQEASIREILKRDSMPRLNKHKPELHALLAPDQQAAYEQFEQETQRDKERLIVHQAVLDMLINLQSNVGLNQEQQDKALSALLEYGERKVMYDGSPNQSHDSSTVMAAEEDLARLTLNALKGILTDEQMSVYQNYEEQMLKVKQFRFPSEKQ